MGGVPRVGGTSEATVGEDDKVVTAMIMSGGGTGGALCPDTSVGEPYNTLELGDV